MQLLVGFLLLCLAANVVANPTPTIDRNHMAKNTKTETLNRAHVAGNPLLSQLLDACHKHNLVNVQKCITRIDKEDVNVLNMAGRCICDSKEELTYLDKIPARKIGLATSCREPTPLPNLNIHDVTIRLHEVCQRETFHQRWPFCILF